MRTPVVILCTTILVCRGFSAWADPKDETDDEPPATVEEPAPAPKRKAVPFEKRWLDPYFTQGHAAKAAAAYRSGDYAEAAQEIASALAKLKKDHVEYQPLRFLLAMAEMNQSGFKAAGDLFEDLFTHYPVLAPYHAFYAARCRVRRNDLEGALVWFARIPAGSVLEAEATMFKVDAYVGAKRWTDVENETTSFLSRFPKGARRAEAMFQRAEAMAMLGRPILDTAAAYRKVWTEAPLDPQGTKAGERLDALAKANPNQAATIGAPTADQLRARGMIFFNANQNSQAEAAFTAALAQPGIDKTVECSLRYHLAQTVWKLRQRPRAAPLFEQAVSECRIAGDRDLAAKGLYQGARSYSFAGDKEKALAFYAQIEKDFPEHRYADDARLRAAEVYMDQNKKADAEKILADLAELYPKGDMAPEAMWRLAFSAFQNKDWTKTIAILDDLLKRFPREDIFYAEGRAYYFKARALQLKGEHKEARQAYETGVREYPLSVYTLFALERMRSEFPEARSALLKELREHMGERASPWTFGPQPLWGEPGFLRAVELARLGMGNEAKRELLRLGIAGGKKATGKATGNEDALWITAILLHRGDLWHASHAIPRYTLPDFRRAYPTGGRHEAEWELGFPRAFEAAVVKNGKANKVPEALQWAIMREESAFYPKAESFVNALGLTQMMKGTAQRFTKDTVTRDMLLDPEKNLELGSRFLGFLLEHYSGTVPLAISGYNAGEGAVDRWMKERSSLDLDEFIETIPYDETRGYTKRVLSTYLTYTWLYGKDKPVPPINFSLKKVELKKVEIKIPGSALPKPGRKTTAHATVGKKK